jgi:lysophospholipase L1-like esterase
MIHLYGDSITAGVPGVPFYKYLTSAQPFKAYGIGGDTVTGLLGRTKSVELNLDDQYVLEIGTNDILLPYLRGQSISWQKTVEGIEKSGRRVTADIMDFTEKYSELLDKFNCDKTFVVSIPCIGEDIGSDLNKKVDAYNEVIKRMCADRARVFIDFNTWQKLEIKKSNLNNKAFISRNALGMIADVAMTKIDFMPDVLSKKRNLLTTIDGVHLNSHGAEQMARMIESAFA